MRNGLRVGDLEVHVTGLGCSVYALMSMVFFGVMLLSVAITAGIEALRWVFR